LAVVVNAVEGAEAGVSEAIKDRVADAMLSMPGGRDGRRAFIIDREIERVKARCGASGENLPLSPEQIAISCAVASSRSADTDG
jgi:hypothetical protein